MFEVTIENDGVKTVISSDNDNFPKIKGGSIAEEINAIPSFSFTIYPNNPGYNLLEGMFTTVTVYNSKTGRNDFEGRVLTVSDSMDESGLICKSVVCEGKLGYLCDSIQPYSENHNISVRNFLSQLLDEHNSQSSFEIHAGSVTVKDSNDSLYRYTNYETTLECIKSKLIDKLGGELQLRYNSSLNCYFLDYLEQIGSPSSTVIELAVNLKSITREIDPTSIITRLYPLGAKESDSERRLTIASVNGGKTYIENSELKARYGVISGVQTWDDVTLASNLLTKGEAFLEEQNKALKKYQITALDLSLINLEFEQFEVGNTHRVKNSLMGIDEDLRIIGRTVDLDNPQNSSLTFGDRFETLTNLTATKNRTLRTVIEDNQFHNMTVINEKVENATQLITGAQGGYVMLDPSEKPERILIMNSDSIETCTSCIQLNKNGLGFWKSSDGGSAKDGPYKNAWTIDGNLVAEFITALTLTGLKINNGNGTFKVDEDGNVTLKSATITNGEINCGNGKFKVDSSGNVTANGAVLSSVVITNGNFKVDKDGNVIMISGTIKSSDERYTIKAENAGFIITDNRTGRTAEIGCDTYNNGESSIMQIKCDVVRAEWIDVEGTINADGYITGDDFLIPITRGSATRVSLWEILKNGGLI